MSQNIESTLLEVIDKVDDITALARIGDHKKHLRTPEFHVVFTRIQH